MNSLLKILVIEDVHADFLLIKRQLQQGNIEAEYRQVDSNIALEDALKSQWDLVLADYTIPGMDFKVILHRVLENQRDLPIILVSGSIGEETAIELLHLGLTDFILKDHLIRLPTTIKRSLSEVAERRARQVAEQALIKGQADALEEQQLARMAALNLLEDALAARARGEIALTALEESEEKYRLLAENAADCIFWIDITGQYKYISPACNKIFGRTSAELITNPELLIRSVHPDDRTAYRQYFMNNTHTQVGEVEFRVIVHGNLHWISSYSQLIHDKNGLYIGQRGAYRDITERKLAVIELESERDRNRAYLNTTQTIMVALDITGNIDMINRAGCEILGYESSELIGLNWFKHCLPQPEGMEELFPRFCELMATHPRVSEYTEKPILLRDGTERLIAWHITYLTDAQGQHSIGTLSSGQDITDSRKTESQLRKLSQAVEQSPESIVITDLNANIEYVNESFLLATLYQREEIIGKNLRILNSGKTPKSTYQSLWKHLLAGESWQGEFHNQRKDGTDYIEHAIISPIREPDGSISHYLAVKEDITEKKRAEAEIHRLIFYDTLTKLPNRSLMQERLAQTLAITRRSGNFSAQISININRFRTINDAGGQEMGDALLKEVGERLSHIMREEDVVARIAGDEFGILLADLAPQQHTAAHLAMLISEKIHFSFNEPFYIGNERITLTACHGIALFPESSDDSSLDILRRTNTALHYARTSGPGQTAFFEGSLDAVAKQRFVVERELHQAILANELRVYLQKQVDASGKIVGAEALVRWQHPTRGLVPPIVFIPIAEESNLIIEIDTWVFTEVCRLLAREEVSTYPLRIAVNISPRHFRQINFVEQIKQGLALTGADPTHITLEVTEGMLIDNINDVIAKMNELSSLGIHFSMDDFGTGYSSLSYLKRIPIHELKIDKSFVQDVTNDSNSAALVETILAVAKHMRLKVVAEGVETAEQADFLNQRGQVIHQGYFFGKPEPMEIWLKNLIG